MKKIKITLVFAIVGANLLLGFQNCSQAKFSSTDLLTADKAAAAGSGVIVDKSLSFAISSQDTNKMDILFVIDNSVSMKEEQLKISQMFSQFISSVSTLDWRIAITTTDNSGSYQGAHGSLLLFKPKDATVSYAPNTFFIDKNTLNGNTLFVDTINTGTAGSSKEPGLTSVMNFIDRALMAGTNENSFFRPDAVFSTIIVTDSDQFQNSTDFNTADQFLSQLRRKLPNKGYINHSSIVMPGDSVCRADGETYGYSYFDLSELTGGVAASICSTDYAEQFRLMAQVLVTKVSEKTLECVPVDANQDGALDISITGSAGNVVSDYSVINGVTVKFNSPLQIVDTYTITYKCAM